MDKDSLMLDSIKEEPTGKALNMDTTALQRVDVVRENIQRHLNTYGKDRQQYITIDECLEDEEDIAIALERMRDKSVKVSINDL